MHDKEHYQVIAKELETNNVDSVLWLQAKATAGGDRDKTEAAYIKLRFSDLKRKKLLPNNSSVNAQVPELSRIRADLAKRLLIQGKKSLYSILNLHPDATDSVIAAAIADIESRNLDDSNVSLAEFKYAKDTLGNPELREQYDRQLLNSLLGIPKPYISSYDDDNEYSWWESRKTSAIIGVCSVALLGFLGLEYWKESHTNNIQRDIVDLDKETTHVATDIEQTKVEADIALKEKMLTLQEERQRRDLEFRSRAADQMLEQQRSMQEARANAEIQRQQAEQKRQEMQREQAEKMRLAREKQYYVCLNQQLSVQLSQRNGSSYDAYARCAMYQR